MSVSHEDDKIHMNYLKIFFKRKNLLFIPAFLGLALGICASMLLPKEYISSTILLVEEGKTDNPLFDKLAISSNIAQRMDTIKESILGWNSIVELVKRLKMDRNIKTAREYESLILKLRSKLVIKLKSHNIIQIGFFGKEPELTRDIVKNITEIFVDRNLEIQNSETSDAIIFIEEQLKVYKGKIKSSEIAALKDQLNVLLVDSTEMHPTVRKLREQLEAKEAELRAENLEYTESSSLNTKTNNPLINEIKKALGSMDGKSSGVMDSGGAKDDIYKVMLIDKLDSAVARDVNVNTKIYNMLLERQETAKITQRLQMSNEGTKYTILDPPRIPLYPSKPNKMLIILGGLIGGLGLGAGLIFAIEFLDTSFIDVEEAAQFLGAPLIGAISKINTIENVKKAKEKVIFLYIATVVAGGVLIISARAIAPLLNK